MNFFKGIYEFVGSGKVDLSIAVSRPVFGKLTVTVLPKATAGDKEVTEELKKLNPFTVTGTPEELDEGFLAELGKAGVAINGLVSSVDRFTQSVADSKNAVVKKTEKQTATNKKKAAPVVKTAGKQDEMFK